MKSWKIGRRLPGGLVKIGDHEQKEPEDRMPPGRGPLAISPIFGKVIFWRALEIIHNFQRKFKGQWIRFGNLYWPHHTPHFSATREEFGPPFAPDRCKCR